MVGKKIIPKALFNIVGLQLLTRYHFLMYFVVVPALVSLLGYGLRDESRPINWIGKTTFLIAGTMGVMVLEDCLFFIFSSIFRNPYPHAFAHLLKGEAMWHPSQVKIGKIFLPATYLWVPVAVSVILWIGFRFGG